MSHGGTNKPAQQSFPSDIQMREIFDVSVRDNNLVARDWNEPRILRWLHHLGTELGIPRWRPRGPHRVIAAALHRKAQEDALTAVPADLEHEEHLPHTGPNTAFQQATAILRTPLGAGAEPPGYAARSGANDEAALTPWELAHLREAARTDPALILACAHIAGREAAITTYGTMATAILDAPAAYTGFSDTPHHQPLTRITPVRASTTPRCTPVDRGAGIHTSKAAPGSAVDSDDFDLRIHRARPSDCLEQ
ncbi:hypothetical protein ABZ642_42055 [Streptomyces sp. NPDC007157]|uniref:hypothetical protein n=1 Tax=Streptomyces sp. NPDC007157 TaxID=3154681 RepID=UPI0033FB3B83